MVVLKVPADCVGASVEALLGEALLGEPVAELDDEFDRGRRCRTGLCARACRPRLERFVTLSTEPGDQRVDLRPRDTVGGGNLAR